MTDDDPDRGHGHGDAAEPGPERNGPERTRGPERASTPEVTVRGAVPADRNAVWAVHDRAFRAAPIDFEPAWNRYLRSVPGSFEAAGGEFLVGTVPVPPADPAAGPDGDPLGYGRPGERVVAVGGYVASSADVSSVEPSAPVDPGGGTAELRSVRVDPAVQRRGIGRRLVTDLHDRARAAGYRRVVLDTNVASTAARSLYRSLGYRTVGRERRAGVAVVYLEREL